MARFEHAPIHRHDAIAPLSRDHYVGLVQARHLIKSVEGEDAARRRIVAEFVDVWDREIVEHFRDEERLLLPLMKAADQKHMMAEHEQIAELADRVRDQRRQVAPDASLLKELGELLDRHIRWEERELFDRLQEDLDANELDALRKSTTAIELTRPRGRRRTPAAEAAPDAKPEESYPRTQRR